MLILGVSIKKVFIRLEASIRMESIPKLDPLVPAPSSDLLNTRVRLFFIRIYEDYFQ